jgi:hypothetical protein
VANDSALLDLQGALWANLQADAALAVDVGDRIYDEVPEDAARPYVTLGEAVETPANDVAAFGSRIAATLHIWSDYGGFAEALGIARHLVRVLDHQQLLVPGRALVLAHHEQTITMRDPDPDVRHVAVRFAFETYPT